MKNSFKIYILILLCFLFFQAPEMVYANTLPEILSVSAPQAVEDSVYTLEITVQDNDLINGDSLSFKIYDPPAWLNIVPTLSSPAENQVKASFTGTPLDEIENTYYIIIEVTDSQNAKAASEVIPINIKNINDQPTISADLPEPGDPGYPISAIQNVQFIFEPIINDPDTKPADLELTWTTNTDPKPAWLNISGLTLTGTPGNFDVGIIENIVISVSDKLDDQGEIDNVIDASLPGFDLCVINTNDPPEFQTTVPPVTTILQGGSYSLALSATDKDLELLESLKASAPPLYWTKCWPGNEINDSLDWDEAAPPYVLLSGPEWLQIESNPDDNKGALLVNLPGRPNNDDVGTYNDIEVIVRDGQGKTGRLEKFSITVENVNDPPFFTHAPTPIVEINEDQEIEFKYTPEAIIKTNIIKANDIDLKHGDQLSFSLESKPVWLNIVKVSDTEAKLTGTPANKDVGIYNDIKLIVTDTAGITGTHLFTLEVNNVNDPPQFIQKPANDPLNPIEINEGASFKMLSPEVIAVAQDIDRGDSITFNIITSPVTKWLSVNTALTTDPASGITTATASFDGIPGNADVGTYKIEVIAEDNSSTKASAIFYLKVNNVNTGPRILTGLPATLTAYEDQSFSQKIIVEDQDLPYGDKLTVSLANAPSWLSYSIDTEQNILLKGIPRYTDAGIYKGITLSVKDTAGESDYITFNIEVIEVNDAPVISGKIPPAILGRNYYFLPEASDEEGDPLIFTLTFITDYAEWLKINPLTGELSGVPEEIKGYFITIDVSDGKDGYAKLGPFLLNVITGPGDIDGSGRVDLKDAVTALQIAAGINPDISPGINADINEDGVLGLEEAVYILNSIAGRKSCQSVPRNKTLLFSGAGFFFAFIKAVNVWLKHGKAFVNRTLGTDADNTIG